MRPRGILLAAAVLACGFAPAPFPKPKKDRWGTADLKALQGTWSILSREQFGANLAKRGGARTVNQVLIEADRWSYVADHPGGARVTAKYTIKLDTSKSPHLVDMARDGLPGYMIVGVYALDGD